MESLLSRPVEPQIMFKFCPTCGARHGGEAVRCTRCRLRLPDPNADPYAVGASARLEQVQQTLEVACNYLVLAVLSAGFLCANLAPFTIGALGVGAEALMSAAGPAYLGLGIALLLTSYQLVARMRQGTPLVWVLGLLFPCVNLLLLLVLCHKANRWLLERGVRMGFLGPTAQEIARLEAEVNDS